MNVRARSAKRKRKVLRDFHTLQNDCVLPNEMAGGPCEGPQNRRHEAILCVMCQISNADYASLVKQLDAWSWFIPDARIYGMVEPVPCGGGQDGLHRIIYLSPLLEKETPDVLVAVVAHELAHIALGHEMFNQNDKYEKHEKQVFQRLCEWGFTAEAKKHRA